MNKKTSLSILVLVFFSSVKSQGFEKTPLFDFLENNFDSTIIYFPTSNWHIEPNYFIISKNDTSYYLYTYRSPYRRAGLNPDVLKLFFVTQHIRFTQTIPDTNRYFLPKTKYNQDSILELKWQEIVSNDSIWHLPDDGALGEPKCPEGGPNCEVYDVGTDVFILVSPQGIKSLSFYAPGFFEECCKAVIPGRKNELQIRNNFHEIFKDEMD